MSTDLNDPINEKRKEIWGDHCDYDVDFETDDHLTYWTCIKEDFGDRFGKIVFATPPVEGLYHPGDELDRILSSMVEHTEISLSGTKEKNP